MAGRRVELGFVGGSVVRLTVSGEAATALASGLGNGDGPAHGWRTVQAEEGAYTVNLAQLVFVRLVPGEAGARVGFSSE